jgi:hypothetical protein
MKCMKFLFFLQKLSTNFFVFYFLVSQYSPYSLEYLFGFVDQQIILYFTSYIIMIGQCHGLPMGMLIYIEMLRKGLGFVIVMKL